MAPASLSIAWCKHYNASNVPPELYNLRFSQHVNVFFVPEELTVRSLCMCVCVCTSTFFVQQPALQTARGCLFLSRLWTLSVWFVRAKYFLVQQPALQTARGCLFLLRPWTLSVWFVCAKHFLFSTTCASDSTWMFVSFMPVDLECVVCVRQTLSLVNNLRLRQHVDVCFFHVSGP